MISRGLRIGEKQTDRALQIYDKGNYGCQQAKRKRNGHVLPPSGLPAATTTPLLMMMTVIRMLSFRDQRGLNAKFNDIVLVFIKSFSF